MNLIYLLQDGMYLLIFGILPGYIAGKRKSSKGTVLTTISVGILFYLVSTMAMFFGTINRTSVEPIKYLQPFLIGILGAGLCYLGSLIGRKVSH